MRDLSKINTEQHESIYIEKIAPRYLPKSKPQDDPCAVITGGQPGSGKSSLTAMAVKRFQDSGYVLVDADKMRPYHPDYSNLLHSDDKTAANLTHADCGQWATRLMRDGMTERRNLIIDQTSRNPAAMETMTRELRQAGYRVELHIMAVSASVSEQRIHQRYEGQRARDGFGRFSTKDKHDEAFAGVAATVAAVEDRKQVDRLCLYNRFAQSIYDNMLLHGQWQHTPSAHQVLSVERLRSMTAEEAYQFATNWESLIRQLEEPERNATEQEKLAMRERYQKAVEKSASTSRQVGKLLIARAEAVGQLARERMTMQDMEIILRQFDQRALSELNDESIRQSRCLVDDLDR